MFDGILSGMIESNIDFDGMLQVMSAAPEASLLSSVADAMQVNNTLDYLSNLYDTKVPDLSAPSRELYNARNKSIIKQAASTVLPANGVVTSRYGYRDAFKRMHKGIDVSLQIGDTVRAALDGRVERVDWDPQGYGLFVVIRHKDGLQTLYGHLSRALTAVGSPVLAGAPVALGGNTGNSTGPHLHFETRRYGEAFDPSLMFDFSRPAGMTRMRSLSDLDKQNPRYQQTYIDDTSEYESDEYNFKLNSGNLTASNNYRSDAMIVYKAAYQERKNNKDTYIIRQGDSLESISRKTGTPILTLCRLNMLSSDSKLKPGRMLRLR